MHPLLLSLGPIHIYWQSVTVVLSWFIFSFLFWRGLRRLGIGEDTTFDLTFYATITALLFARVGFVGFHFDTFVGKSPLLYVALWVAPGLSWTGAFVGMFGTIVLLSRQYKVRLGQVLDALVSSLPLPFIIGSVGTFLDGSQGGRISQMPWAIAVRTGSAPTHPVELYQVLSMLVLSIIFLKVFKIADRKKWPYGVASIWFIFFYAIFMFLIEFVKDTRVYFGNITANQWIYVAVVAECIGVLYVRGGGREFVRPLFHFLHKRMAKIGEKIYAKLPKRRLRNN